MYASAEKLLTRGRFYDEDALAAYDILHYDIDLAMYPERLWLDGETTMRLRIKSNGANQSHCDWPTRSSSTPSSAIGSAGSSTCARKDRTRFS